MERRVMDGNESERQRAIRRAIESSERMIRLLESWAASPPDPESASLFRAAYERRRDEHRAAYVRALELAGVPTDIADLEWRHTRPFRLDAALRLTPNERARLKHWRVEHRARDPRGGSGRRKSSGG
jgi:hypothetical protein